MAQKGLVVSFSILPPGEPGISVRSSYDPDLPDGLLAYEVGKAVTKALKKLKKQKPQTQHEGPAA